MKSSKSKSNRTKAKKFKFVSKSKQRKRVKQPTRNWLDLPSEIMVNILCRIGTSDILENVQKVCTTWHKICKDPALWRVIYIDDLLVVDPYVTDLEPYLRKMCKHLVDRSQGQLVDITLMEFADDELLQYIADRSSQLRYLQIALTNESIDYGLIEALKKLPLLEELVVCLTYISKEVIETLGQCCPLLKTLKVNDDVSWELDTGIQIYNELALAIGNNLPELRHLELVGDALSNIGLEAILNGCRHLESLDLRNCFYVDLEGELGKRCSQQIKYLKRPKDSRPTFVTRENDQGKTCLIFI